ncbi:helix-turn-helix domain-containing protein [Hydrogenophaga sp. IBVHS1]|jgi:AraC-like DNA-binding protein|uniref:AraC family transcriptional regulator n=1 Tax=unclassified Hydrogenophaga TaxID=2610897 RepID=UPI000A2D5E56|nr:helix-turn-helix transcriptional regulator [Hydrogenophaga sp. IBVHS1]OSZ75728.1 AraC family transcriptional regulator [Hydrogenophaga sp. IBVHS1]
MSAPRRLRPTPLGDSDPFTPDASRPVRVRSRALSADTHFEPHSHPWGQLAYCATGIVQVMTVPEDASLQAVTYIVPPSRAVWIAPGMRHAVTVREAAELRTLYIHAGATPKGWRDCRMIVVSSLLRELVQAMDTATRRAAEPTRDRLLASLALDELAHADTQPLGVPLPRDKRLRALCEAVLNAPGERATLAEWAADTGASERTVARLFRDELGTTYQRWRQQAVIAHALPLLARGVPIGQVAAATGYASDSAFSAMFKAAMGHPPTRWGAQDQR